jgi:hypothetical protein
LESLAETLGVLLGDGEDAMTALSAAGPAGEVIPAAVDGSGQCSVHDLGEGWRHDLWRSIRLV